MTTIKQSIKRNETYHQLHWSSYVLLADIFGCHLRVIVFPLGYKYFEKIIDIVKNSTSPMISIPRLSNRSWLKERISEQAFSSIAQTRFRLLSYYSSIEKMDCANKKLEIDRVSHYI